MTITDRIDRVTAIPPEYRGEVLPAPISVKIELTADCNYRCSFCVKSLRAEAGTMDRALYSRLVRECADAGVREWGVFYIGESFVCPWLPEAIAEAKERFEYVFLTTNGSLATPAKLAAVFAAGLDSLKFSINFADEQQFQDVTRVKPSLYRRALDHLRRARDIRDDGGYKCGIYASAIALDGAQGERMRQRVAEDIEPYCDEFYWLPLYGMGGAAEAAGLKPQAGNPGRLAAMRPPLPCWSAFTEGHITARGALSACCFGRGADDSLVMADLTQVSFMEGWNSEAFQRLRRAHLAQDVADTACAECMGS